MYVLSIANGSTLRSAEIQRMIAEAPYGQHTMFHFSAIERIEARGIKYSNEDFDVLSAAHAYAVRQNSSPFAQARACVKGLAHRSFVAMSRDQAIAQSLWCAIERRDFVHDGACTLGHAGISWKVARMAIRKAKQIRDAADWQAAYRADLC